MTFKNWIKQEIANLKNDFNTEVLKATFSNLFSSKIHSLFKILREFDVFPLQFKFLFESKFFWIKTKIFQTKENLISGGRLLL